VSAAQSPLDGDGIATLPVPPAATPALGFRQTFAALRHPNYRLWFAGQLISLFGGWMQITAQGFLIFELTHSAAYLGYVGFASGVPAWLLTLYGGVIADRTSRRRLIIITQAAMMAQAGVLALLTFTGVVQPYHIILLAFSLGIINAFDAPARQSFIPEMVCREDLTNAIALNSAIFNTATMLGPAAAGVVYAWVGPAWCFLANAVTYLGVIGALALMRLPPHVGRSKPSSPWADVRQGLAFVISQRTLVLLLSGLAVTSVFGISMLTLVPAWTVRVLHGDASTNGWLLSSRGVGSLAAALMVATLGRANVRGRLLTLGSLVAPVMMVGFSLFDTLIPALLFLVGMGWAFLTIFNSLNALIQTLVPDELRGRVMGLYTMLFFGLMPVGSLLAGVAADAVGEAWTLRLAAVTLGTFAILLALRFPSIRRLA
jgi:MFS family permease